MMIKRGDFFLTTCSCCRVTAGSGRAAAAAAQNTSTSTNAYIRVFLPEHVLNRAVEGWMRREEG